MPKSEFQPEAISQVINSVFQAMLPAFMQLADAIQECAEFISVAFVRVQPLILRLTVTQRLEIFGWQGVDPHDLTPEERWEYQRWVMSTPMRWVNHARQQWLNF